MVKLDFFFLFHEVHFVCSIKIKVFRGKNKKNIFLKIANELFAGLLPELVYTCVHLFSPSS